MKKYGIVQNLRNIVLVMKTFKIDNELKSENIARTVRFTEPLFDKLNTVAQKIISHLIY